MRNKILKKPMALLLAVCMTVSVFSAPVFAEDLDSTGSNSASTEKIDECKTIVQGYTAKQAARYIAGDNTYPAVDGYVFSGWYTDAACTKLLNGAAPSGTTYALFVPNHVLSVKAQISAGLTTQNWNSTEKASIRFITTVDSLRYKEIGFDLSYKGADGKTYVATSSAGKVYHELYVCGSNDTVWDATPEGTFCGLSQYFRLCTLKDFTVKTFYETAFTIKPYWITADGDKVYGVTATKSMKEGCLKQEVSITINETENGTVTKAAETYKVGDTVQLTATPNEGYNLTSLTVTKDGAAVDIGTVDFAGGTYSFVTEGGSYVVNAEFKQKIFVEANSWDLTKQYEGEIALSSNGQTQSLTLYGQYTNFDFTIKVKDDPTVEDNSNDHRTTVKLTFDETIEVNGESKQLSIWTSVHESPGSKWVVLQNVKTEGNTYDSNNDTTYYHGEKEDAEWQAYHTAEGIDYRVVRQGTNLLFYLNGTCRKTIDLSSYIKADTQMTASIIHHNGDTGAKINIPYTLRDAVSDTTINLETNEIGTLQIQNSYKLVGDEIVISQEELKNPDYYLAGLKIDGKEVELALDGTYRFVATKSEHTVEGIYKKAIFDSAVNANVSLVHQNQGMEDGVTTGTVWVLDGEYSKQIYMKEQYTDIDFTIKVKDDPTIDDADQDHRRSIKLTFDNGVVIVTSVHQNTSNKLVIQNVGSGEGNTYDTKYTTHYVGGEKDADWMAYHTAEGIDFRVVRQGRDLMFYLNGKLRKTIDMSNHIDAETKVTAAIIHHNGDTGMQVAIPYEFANTLRTSQIQFASNDFGSLVTEKDMYYLGDTVVVEEEELNHDDYYLAGLKIDGKEVELAPDGTYGFVAIKSKHEVEGIYKKAIFNSNVNSNVSLVHQNQSTEDGVTTGTIWVLDGNYSKQIHMKEKYTDIDLTIKVKDDPIVNDSDTDHRRSVRLEFDNGVVIVTSVHQNTSNKLVIQNVGSGEGNTYDTSYTPHYIGGEKDADWVAYHTAEGIDFRVVRQGTNLMFYLNGTHRKTIDLSNHIDATTKVKASIIHHNGEAGTQVAIPYALRHIPSNQINIVSSEYGSIAMTSTNNLVGEEVVFKQEAWLNEEYYLSGLIIDGTEVELDSDGTYRFVTTKSVHTVEGVYREAIFAPKAAWNLAKQNLSTAEGVTTGEISLVANAHDKLEFQKQYTDMDLTLRVKDDQSDSTQGRTSVEFTFDNGATLYPSIGGEGYFQLKASTITDNKWVGPYNLNLDELALYQSGGIDFRIVRNGTVFTAYITDVTNPTQMEQIWTADYEEYIDADTKATVAITHDDDKGIKIVMPFVLKVPQEISSFQGESEDG